MKYVKIRAVGYNEALMELRKQHGDEAIPISHKYVKEGGILNSRLFAKDVVELTAAIHDKRRFGKIDTGAKKSLFDAKVDNDIMPEIMNSQKLAQNRGNSTGLYSTEKSSENNNLNDVLSNLNSLRKNIDDSKNISTSPAQNDSYDLNSNDGKNLQKFEREFDEIKNTLEKLMNKYEVDRGHKDLQDEQDKELLEFRVVLRDNDYDDKDCDEMLSTVKNSISRDDLKDKYKIQKSLKDLVRSKIVTSGPIQINAGKKKVLMFVGPTGVGKTTSLAKLGANFALRDGRKVAFVTIDTYRIAATEQLKKYAEIMKIPVHVVNDQKEFKSVIAKEKAEVILVDTSGRSHKNKLKISEIKSYADQIDADFEKILCVSAGTKKADLKSIFSAFEPINPNNVLITKVDETSFVGNVVDVADKYNKPVSYVSNGQEVPTDICVADKELLADMIIPEQP